MQSNINLDPANLSSSPLRQLYDVLSTFEKHRDWSKAAREELLKKVAARAQQPQQYQPSPTFQTFQDSYGQLLSPSTSLTSTGNTLGDLERMLGIPVDDPDVSTPLPNIEAMMGGIDPSKLSWIPDQSQAETLPLIPLPIPKTASELEPSIDTSNGLPPQFAELMTPRETAAFNMLQMFQQISEKRIESWNRIARLMVLQPMDGFAAVGSLTDV
jgi:hypothetical protein